MAITDSKSESAIEASLEPDQRGSDTRIDAAPPTLQMQSFGYIVVVNQLSECLSLVRL